MKIAGLQPFTLSDFPGKSAAILFTLGCNLRCPFCHNHQLITDKVHCLPKEQIFDFLTSRQKQLEGIVITGGEPTIQTDLIEFITSIKELDYEVKLDTNGTRPSVMKELIEKKLIDYIAMDIKAPFYKYSVLSGSVIDTNIIQQSIQLISTSNIPHLFRTTNFTDLLTEEDLIKIKQLIPIRSKYIIQQHIPT